VSGGLASENENMARDGFDITFPVAPLTGKERSAADLASGDERITSYGLTAEALQAPFLRLENYLATGIPRPLHDRILVCRQLAAYGFLCYDFHAVSMSWSLTCVEMALKLKFREMNPRPIQLERKRDGVEETCETALTELEERLLVGWHIAGMEDFDYSFGRLLAWAFRTGLLPDDLPIPLQEITNRFSHRLEQIFFNAARKDGLIGPNPTVAEVTSAWFALTDEQSEHYRYKPSAVLIEELPRLADALAHPEWCNLLAGPRSPLKAYELLIEFVASLWPAPSKPTWPDRLQSQEPTMPDQRDRPENHAERITLYDSIHIPAGSRTPERITFSFGADGGDVTEERLFDLGEPQLIEQVLTNPLLVARLLEHFEIHYPNCWIITEMLTRSASPSWSHPKPGDLDIVCGRMKNGHPDFDFICGAQVKIRKVKTLDETGNFASGTGTEQSHWTAKMGFDRTLLLHCIVRVPQAVPDGYAPSWNPIINADFERAAKSCYGTIRTRFEKTVSCTASAGSVGARRLANDGTCAAALSLIWSTRHPIVRRWTRRKRDTPEPR